MFFVLHQSDSILLERLSIRLHRNLGFLAFEPAYRYGEGRIKSSILFLSKGFLDKIMD
jgi:hypothetical protein